ncbi:HNH endonuclease [candidate division KSB1 bacterium]|nr:HNH endonuclease [candidate division KSB1 bacterium]
MSYIPANLRRLVIQRAGARCEYCRLAQVRQEATFHIDHILPIKQGGKTIVENLALACMSCSLHKAARFKALDIVSGDDVQLYNPRRDSWNTHFEWHGDYIIGLTATGRATVEALKLNRTLALAIRHEEAMLGRHPPA